MSAARSSLDIVTVVFRDELPLLALQARSIARYFDPAAIGGIFVIVNDRAEADCARAVEALRFEYGALAPRVQIVSPDVLVSGPAADLRGRLERFYITRVHGRLRNLLPQRRRLARGWRGNSGWAMQQAFKLLSCRVGTGSHILILDAKNHFVAPAGLADFISETGKARSRKHMPGALLRGWVDASFARLGYPVPDAGLPVPPSVTPVAIGRDQLADAVASLEEKVGPLELFFAHRRGKATEFMLLYAETDRGTGSWWSSFALGLPQSLTVFSGAGMEKLGEVMQAARAGQGIVMGVHRRQVLSLPRDLRDGLFEFWRERGLVRDATEAQEMFGA